MVADGNAAPTGGSRAGARPPGDGEARTDGLEHLRAAAGELIGACRALLDVAEELLDDPAAVGAVAEGFGSLLRGAADLGRRATGVHVPGRAGGGGDADHADHADDAAASGGSRVQRIRVVE